MPPRRPVIVVVSWGCFISWFTFTINNKNLLRTYYQNSNGIDDKQATSKPVIISSSAIVESCTPEQLSIIQKQLPPDDCIAHKHEAWTQRCSFNYATSCPDSIWIEDFYRNKHKNNQSGNFTGIFVGCNKGMDAVNTLRMGSGNPNIDKKAWKNFMTRGGKVKLGRSVCNQANLPQFELQNDVNTTTAASRSSLRIHNATKSDFSQVHCIEPLPSTFRALNQSAQLLHWDSQGLIVTHAAISKSDGSIPFPSGIGTIGRENLGIANCAIDYLSIDVEGFDMDVILGGSSTLKRVHYLEFEYNWMGSWKNQKLSDTIHLLDANNFTCYWPGYDGNIWRITDCWLDHYELHFWSNVACVKRGVEQVRDVAEDMERLFLETLKKGSELVMDFDHRGNDFQRAKTGDK